MLMGIADDEALQCEIDRLGGILDATIRSIAGPELLRLVNEIRELSSDHRDGVQDAGEQLEQLLSSLDFEQLRVVIRAFAVFLDLTVLG